ncbi:hypothetical protein J6590_041914 [Homalodisca vitripennis]|nr:hypothetical protein J6590_041914 [Homalodisca vitripennis]
MASMQMPHGSLFPPFAFENENIKCHPHAQTEDEAILFPVGRLGSKRCVNFETSSDTDEGQNIHVMSQVTNGQYSCQSGLRDTWDRYTKKGIDSQGRTLTQKLTRNCIAALLKDRLYLLTRSWLSPFLKSVSVPAHSSRSKYFSRVFRDRRGTRDRTHTRAHADTYGYIETSLNKRGKHPLYVQCDEKQGTLHPLPHHSSASSSTVSVVPQGTPGTENIAQENK